MDSHLKSLFGRFQDRFGLGPGLGPGSGVCLMNVRGISPDIIKSLYRTSASLYRNEPWKRLRSGHLFGVRVGKDWDWSGKKQPFTCLQFIGGDGGDIAIYMYRSLKDAELIIGESREMTPVPTIEVLRVTYELETLMFPCNKKMIESLCLEVSGNDRFPVIDVARGTPFGDLKFRNPTMEELRFVYAVMKAVSLIHHLLQEEKQRDPHCPGMIKFVPFIETVDVQWTPEMIKGQDVVAVTISHPPGKSFEENTQCVTEDGSGSKSVLRKCAMCRKSVPNEVSICCSRCNAMIYCSSECENVHWREIHRSFCSRYKGMMAKVEELEIKIFSFPCFVVNPCDWLESLGIHKKGMWRRKCSCFSHSPFGLLPVSSNAISELWGGLKSDEYPQDSPVRIQTDDVPPVPIFLSGWSDYYDLRSLAPSSPVADIMSYPLTLYHIVTTHCAATKNRLLKGREVIVHYLGPEPELDWIQAFAEISHLLNGSGTIQITMIGPKIPSALSGTKAITSNTNNNRIKLNFVKGLYQNEVGNLSSPDVIVALNCDLEGYSSWEGALEVMNSIRVPGFFTSKSEESCLNDREVLRNIGFRMAQSHCPNPFRSPLRTFTPSANIPCYSNGFIFGVDIHQ